MEEKNYRNSNKFMQRYGFDLKLKRKRQGIFLKSLPNCTNSLFHSSFSFGCMKPMGFRLGRLWCSDCSSANTVLIASS